MRLFLLLIGLAALAGCDVVTTRAPLVTASAGGPQLKLGVWIAQVDSPCDFDTSAPVRRWPRCATGFIVRGREIIDPSPGATPRRVGYQLSVGDPLIVQVRDPRDGRYSYGALRVETTDSAGAISSIRAWAVPCGPGSLGEQKRLSDISGGLFPGFTRSSGATTGCTTVSLESVRTAALFSQSSSAAAHWLRAGKR